MLLRHITNHVKAQNWFAVGLDFLIVVVGVFIGLQVSNWNEARSSARIETELRATLERDFVELEAQLSDRIQTIITLGNDVSELLDIVRADVAPKDSEATILLLNAASTLPRLPSPPASYAEITSAGRLSTLSDPELRRALSRYGQTVELYQIALPSFRETIFGRDSLVYQAVRINNDLEVARSDIGRGLEGYDWEILKNADNDVQMVLTWMVTGEQLARQQLQEVEAILNLLQKDASP